MNAYISDHMASLKYAAGRACWKATVNTAQRRLSVGKPQPDTISSLWEPTKMELF